MASVLWFVSCYITAFFPPLQKKLEKYIKTLPKIDFFFLPLSTSSLISFSLASIVEQQQQTKQQQQQQKAKNDFRWRHRARRPQLRPAGGSGKRAEPGVLFRFFSELFTSHLQSWNLRVLITPGLVSSLQVARNLWGRGLKFEKC